MVLPDSRNMPPSEVKMFNFIAHLINSSVSSPRLPLPCLPDCNIHLMLSLRLPKIYADGLSGCDNLWTEFSVTLGPRLLMPCFMQLFLCQVSTLNGMLVPFLPLLVAVWFHPACSLSLTQQENKSIDYLCKDKVEAVRSELSSFSPCLKVHSYFLFSIVFEWLVVLGICMEISLSSTAKVLSIRL